MNSCVFSFVRAGGAVRFFPGRRAAAAALALALFGVSCQEGGLTKSGKSAAPPPAGPAQVRVAKVSRHLFSDRVEALGTLRALEAVNISSNVTDRVAEIFFEDGAIVKKGDLLVHLEDTEEKAALEAAKSLEAEQEREIERLRGLVKSGAVSEVRLREYETQRDIAARKVEEARAKVEDRNIRAPYDGVLGFREISNGTLLTPGDLIATFDVLDPVKLDFTVPETFLGGVAPGLRIEAETGAYPGEKFQGKVTQIDTRVNPVTRSATVRAAIPNADHRLRPGMLMTTVLESNPVDSPCLPERALVSVGTRHFIFVVKEGAPARVIRTQVEIGRREPGLIEIRSGVKEGEIIVTDGLVGLSDGAEVKVTGQFEGPAEPYRPAGSS